MKLLLTLAIVALVGYATARPARDLKSDLTTKGNDLVKQLDEAITKLTTDKKEHEATVLKTQEEHLKKLIADLTAATEEAKVKQLEHELQMVEGFIARELARINHTQPQGPNQPTNPESLTSPQNLPNQPNQPSNPVTRDLKADLTTKGNDLVKKLEEAITKATTDKKDHEVTILKAEEEHLKKLIADLTAATDEVKQRQLERELSGLEARIEHELARINHVQPTNPNQPTNPQNQPSQPNQPSNPVTRDLKADLTTKGNDLVKKLEEAITKATTDKKDHEVTILKAEEEHLKKLIADLTAATDEAKQRQLERELGGLEARIEHELARINHTQPQGPNQPTNPENQPSQPNQPTNP